MAKQTLYDTLSEKEKNIKKDFHPITMDAYSFIDKHHNPSFIDCGKLFFFSKDRFMQEKGHRGYLTTEDCDIALDKIKNSERIETIDLLEFGFIEEY